MYLDELFHEKPFIIILYQWHHWCPQLMFMLLCFLLRKTCIHASFQIQRTSYPSFFQKLPLYLYAWSLLLQFYILSSHELPSAFMNLDCYPESTPISTFYSLLHPLPCKPFLSTTISSLNVLNNRFQVCFILFSPHSILHHYFTFTQMKNAGEFLPGISCVIQNKHKYCNSYRLHVQWLNHIKVYFYLIVFDPGQEVLL